YSRTWKHLYGRLVRAALVLIICDLPAAHKFGGFGGCSHRHFCNVCCTFTSLQIYRAYSRDTMTHSWVHRTNNDTRQWAQRYADAPKVASADKFFKKSGQRWTCLLLLPYFDLSCMIVMDCMHNLFLGVIKEHFHRILGFRVQKNKPYEPEVAQPPKPTLGYHPGSVTTKDEMETFWRDLGNMIKLSWLTSVPAKVGGNESDGKLKADQWWVLRLTFIPLSLIPMWSNASPQKQELLKLTMDLVSTVIVATLYKTSAEHGQIYTKHMMAYHSCLQSLFPSYECHPNHHMSMHIEEYLALYGPAQGWWAFLFERAIGQLQRISTNYKPGELQCLTVFRHLNVSKGEYEETISRSWHCRSNFCIC
ncbi:uncharacterized protein EV420DRAFT_1259314, partial [Desarmillaria tabescens]